MKKLYFARQTNINNTEYELNCINKINELYPEYEIVKFDNIPVIPESLTGIKREVWLNDNYFFPLIDKADVFFYTFNNDIAPKGSNVVGIKGELNHIIHHNINNKPVFKITGTGVNSSVNSSLDIREMNSVNFQKMYEENKKARNGWVLKTIKDYRTFYENNPEAVKLIISQFKEFNINGIIAEQPVIPHRNTLWMTKDFKRDFELEMCKIHNLRHAFINTGVQQYEYLCPYYGESVFKPSYGKRKLDSIKEYDERLILGSRVIHKLFWIIDKEAFKPMAFCLKDKEGNLILQKDGDVIADVSKILGAEPLFDIDIKEEVKNTGKTFFSKDIFNEYLQVIKICENYIENNLCGMEYKRGFSGNGVYFIFEPVEFLNISDEDGKTHYDTNAESFSENWLSWIKDIQKEIDKKDIKSIKMERLYGWNRYFKTMGTFHANKERIAIPLNKDEVLNWKWIDEITKIENGLYGNIFQEILKKAGNTWR